LYFFPVIFPRTFSRNLFPLFFFVFFSRTF
jgi:hypothetical protein